MTDIITQQEAGVTLRYGFVAAVDAQTHRARVFFPDLDLTSWWLMVLTPGSRGDRHYALPDIGEHVVCLLDARGEAGVVLGSLYSARDPVPVDGGPDRHHIWFSDDTEIDYDRRTHRLLLSVRGPVEIVADGPVTVTAPQVTLNAPQVVVTGNVQVQGSIEATGSIMDAGGNSNHHSH